MSVKLNGSIIKLLLELFCFMMLMWARYVQVSVFQLQNQAFFTAQAKLISYASLKIVYGAIKLCESEVY